MKRIFTLLSAVLITGTVLAQSPQKMSYQAVIRNSSNALITLTTVRIRISILQGSLNGLTVYEETQTPTTNANGLASVEIGSGTIVSGDFSAINWTGGPYFIKTETDPSGGTNYSITGTSQLVSVPYALHAKSAESVSGPITETQNLADVISVNNSANGQIKNLSDPIDEQDAVTKAYVDGLKEQIIELQVITGVKVKDADGNIYTKVKIGLQTWLAENLKTTKYNDGTPIPHVTESTEWPNLETPGYCWYNNDEASFKNTYGALYNWYAVDIGKVCPAGWHVPSDYEWTDLTVYLNNNGFGYEGSGDDIAKSMAATSGWYNSDIAGTVGNDQTSNNSSGFSAVAGGYRDASNGDFANLHFDNFWWSDIESDADHAWFWKFSFSSSTVEKNNFFNKKTGFSIRCVED